MEGKVTRMGYGSKSISDWIDDVHALARKRGWWVPYEAREGALRELSADQVLAKLMLVVTEIAEAAEEVRLSNFKPRETSFEIFGAPDGRLTREKFREDQGRYPDEDIKPLGFPSELADAVIRIFDLCGAMGIDLEQAIREKHAHNETRAQRHGGKRA